MHDYGRTFSGSSYFGTDRKNAIKSNNSVRQNAQTCHPTRTQIEVSPRFPYLTAIKPAYFAPTFRCGVNLSS